MNITFNDLLTRKVKLEFGNQDQINAIDAEMKRKEEERLAEEAKEKGENLKKIWSVNIEVSGSIEIEVVAIDEDEAIEKAKDEYWHKGGQSEIDIEIDDMIAHPLRIATENDE